MADIEVENVTPLGTWDFSGATAVELPNDTVDSADMNWADVKSILVYTIDNAGSAITTGVKGDVLIPFAYIIKKVTMLADTSGSLVVDIWKDTYANFAPTDADSITSAAPPTITTNTKSQDSTLTGWTTSITADNILRFNVDSCSTITRAAICLELERV